MPWATFRSSSAVAHVPFVDGVSSTLSTGLLHALQCTPSAVCDLYRMLTFQAPHYMTLVAAPGTFAVFNGPESLPWFSSLLPPGASFSNRVPGRCLLGLLTYRPIASARGVRCPALLIAGDQDSLIAVAETLHVAVEAPRKEPPLQSPSRGTDP